MNKKLAGIQDRKDADAGGGAGGGLCDCAVYDSAGNYITCKSNIREYKCHELAGDGIETNILPVGGCASVPR